MSDKEYVSMYVDKELADRINGVKQGGGEYDELVLECIDKMKKALKNELETVNDDLLAFRGMMAKVRQEYRKTRDEYLESTQKAWEETENQLPSIRDRTKKIVDELTPIKVVLDQINKSMASLTTYDLEKILNLLKDINSCYSGESGKILNFLFQNYNKQ